MSTAAIPSFSLPAELEAAAPPQPRDDVRMLVCDRWDGAIAHARFRELPERLDPGDLLLINVSATLPAAVRGWRPGGTPVEVRFSPPSLTTRAQVVEVRSPGEPSSWPSVVARAGERIELPADVRLRLREHAGSSRLWRAELERLRPALLAGYLRFHGEPVRYGYLSGAPALGDYQNVYATEPGGAEMPSAGRPFTHELITALVARGVLVSPLVLHAGVSSPERGEAPAPEPFRVPAPTARLVNAVHGWGGRVIAVGTTVVRAIESVADERGQVAPGAGITELLIEPERGLRAIDGLLTGWHEPRSTHLAMLVALAGPELMARAYDEALAARYRWHEFGDSMLIV